MNMYTDCIQRSTINSVGLQFTTVCSTFFRLLRTWATNTYTTYDHRPFASRGDDHDVEALLLHRQHGLQAADVRRRRLNQGARGDAEVSRHLFATYK